MPRQTQNPFVGRSLLDFFRMTGSIKLKLDEVAVPVVLLADLSASPNAPQEEATFTMFGSNTVALPQSLILENDSVSSVFLLDEITISSPADALVQMTLTVTPPLNPVAGGAADKTWNDLTQTPIVAGTMFSDSGVFVGPDVWKGPILAAQPHRVRAKLILRSGQQIAITNTTLNQQLFAVIKARIVPVA